MKCDTIHLLLLLVCSVILYPCSKVWATSESLVIHHTKKENTYPLSASAYLAKAEKALGDEKQESLLLAAGKLISEGQWPQGLAILTQTRNLSVRQLNEKKLLLAEIAIIQDKPQEALSYLVDIHLPAHLSPYHQIQYHQLLASAYQSSGQEMDSIKQRITLDALITDFDDALNNKRNLWRTLIHIPTDALQAVATDKAYSSELNGWIQLVLISRAYREHPKSLLAALDHWKTQFNQHPANDILPEPLDSIAHKLMTPPKKIAVLLPLSGPFAGPGQAIWDGFLAAYKASQSDATTKVTSYDTNVGQIEDVYQKAIDEGADYIVGPLIKNQVAVVAKMEHPVPTLLLNDVDAHIDDNSYLLSLSPMEEATQVAIKAGNKGHRRALVIAPENAWGKEVVSAFSKTWTKKGGQIVDAFFYSDTNLNSGMRDVLHINQSLAREKKLKQLLGQSFVSIPSRRQDFDVIFLLAYPSKARQIMPLLKYYYAGGVPVYATSSVYAGNANALKDKDLDGLIFCDIPWVFAHQTGAKNWPEQFNSYNRLYALGMDSFALSTQLNQLILFPAEGSKDITGTLYLKPTQHIARVLEWGQFKEGLAHSLGDMA